VTTHDQAAAAVRDRTDTLVSLSHDLHAHPETAFEEHHAVDAVTRVLSDVGFTVERNVCGLDTAFVATFGTGPVRIGICAEYDALPDVGHACGHNVIAASSVGAGIGLARVADEVGLTVVVLGTPAEEGGGGKITMLDGGAFDGIDAAMMVHPFPVDRMEARCLAVDHLDVFYTGVEAHASAAPWAGVNAGDALTIAQVAIALLRQQLPPGDQVHGIVTSGGVAANIIPSESSARYMCRSLDATRLATLRARIDACFEAGATATGSTLRIETIGLPYSHMISDVALLERYRVHAEALGRRFELDDRGEPLPTISTDMANISLEIPSIHPMLGIDAGGAVNHQRAFANACATPSADRAIVDGAIALAMTAIDVASDEALRASLGTSIGRRQTPGR
jgi:amidohydrolase